MDVSLQIALIVAAGPVATVIVTAVLRLWEKKIEYARQDEVARAAKAASDELIKGQKAAAELLLANNEQVAHVGEETQKQIKVVHSLLNSEKTAAKRESLDTNVSQLASLREIVDLKKTSGHQPTAEALAAIEALCTKIDVMKKELVEREKQDRIAAQIMATPAKDLDSMFDDTLKAISKPAPS